MTALKAASFALVTTALFAVCLGRAQPWGLWYSEVSGPPRPIGTAVKYMKAFRKCDVKGMMELEGPDFKIFTLNGKIINGDKDVGKYHDQRCKRYELGGYGSLHVVPTLYSRDGNAVSYTATVKGDFISNASRYTFSESIITTKVAGEDKIAVLISTMDTSKFDYAYERNAKKA